VIISGEAEDVLFDVRNQVVSFEERKGERLQLIEIQDGSSGGHRYVNQYVGIITIEQEGRFHLK
jgi:hypothetical protein